MIPKTQLVCALIVWAALPQVLAAQEPASEEAKAIAALIQEVETANNEGNVERWVGFFAEDFVYMPANSPPVTDRGELVEMARAGFRNKASIHIEPSEIRVCGDWAFARSRVTGDIELHDSGGTLSIDMKQLVVYTRDDHGSWRIARLIGNSNLP